MSVPKQAMKQLEEVEKALDAIQEEGVSQDIAVEDTYPSEETAPVANEVHNDQELSEQQGLSSEASPANEDLQKELELERQRTASLKGRIDSQLRQANQENKDLKTKMEQMMQKFDEMEQASKEPGFKRNLTPEEIDNVGEEVLELQDRVIKGTIEEELEKGSIKELVSKLVDQSVAARQQQMKPQVDKSWFWSNVNNYYPNAKQINDTDPGWFTFLERYDSVSGLQYREVGNKAIESGDIPALVDLFKTYKPLVVQPEVSEIPVPTVKPESTSVTIPQEVEPEAVFTQAEVKKFFADKARGKFKGSQSDYKDMEEKIMDAAQAGRII